MSRVLLKIVPVSISNRGKQLNTFALLDEGSTITLVDRQLTRAIGIKGQQLDIKIKGIRGEDLVVNNTEKVSFSIQGTFGEHKIESAIVVPALNISSQTICEETVRRVREVANVDIKPYQHAQPRILIGQDNWRLIITREFRDIAELGTVISRSSLGWAIHGTVAQGTGNGGISKMCICLCEAREKGQRTCKVCCDYVGLDELFKSYFQLESSGVESVRPRIRNGRAERILEETSRRVGRSWEIGLLWKDDHSPRVDSRTTAYKRLISLEKKLDRQPEFANLYYGEMGRLIKAGYALKVSGSGGSKREWFLPHFGVQNPNNPNKLRLVFDAAAKTAGVSLNDQLESGPDLLQPLHGVLVRFRQFEIALKADIKDMFLRVRLRDSDRAAQRFLWRGKDRREEPSVYEMTCLIFGAKSSPCSAIFVRNKNAEEFCNSKPEAAKGLIKNSYMDDYLGSCRTIKQATDVVRDITYINAQAGFEMHGWACNAVQALEGVTERAKTDDREGTHLCDHHKERVLGLFWDTRTDELGFNLGTSKIPDRIMNCQEKPTKRELLRVVMSIFDPLGFLSPFLVKSKLLMQEVWRSGIGWDDKIRDEEQVGWAAWLKTLKDIRHCRIPRCYIPRGLRYQRVELHVFCDAGEKAYAAAAYLRFVKENDKSHVRLVMAKSRIAPLKPLSIPRLELQAALLGARLGKSVEAELEIAITRRYYWSDSSTVIRWINSDPRTRQVFVAHRIGEISELTLISDWRWVPSALNPSDDATRWTTGPLSPHSRWFVGPEFLSETEANWPKEKRLSDEERTTIDNLERKKAAVYATSASVMLNVTPFIKILGWRGLLVIARRVRGMVDRWLGRSRVITPTKSIELAEQYWFREIQHESYQTELQALAEGKNINKRSKIIGLNPFRDENGILRANGRVTKVLNAEFNNQPIILDGKHPATRLLIIEYHRRFYHANHDTVINELRQRYYIVGLRNTLRSIISKCLICRLQRGKPQEPNMSALPIARLAFKQRPFSHCGIDYFGPMLVKIGRRREKRWGVLFTCLTVRAIHLELAHSLSASSTILALQRLSARRGTPQIMYSDNGTNFKGASRELKDAIISIDKTTQTRYASTKGIEWKFIPPGAPNMGGAWERLIKSVKIALHTILKDQVPSEEVLITLLNEIEHSVNSRPLTHVSVDPRDKEALTPNHFLIGSSSGELQLRTYDPQNVNLRKQWRIAQAFADSFWRRWLREFVPSLIVRKKWPGKNANLKIGDIVLIADLQAPRNVWCKGTVVEVYPGSDGQVRVAKVRTGTSVFIRPTRKLIKLLGSDEVQN